MMFGRLPWVSSLGEVCWHEFLKLKLKRFRPLQLLRIVSDPTSAFTNHHGDPRTLPFLSQVAATGKIIFSF